MTDTSTQHARPARWAKVIDQTRCIGCHACSTACKSENDVPVGVNRTYVKSVDVGTFPDARRAFQVTRCNQCEHAPCVTACPTAAMFRRPDGIVDFDKSICIGCKACIAACPYDAIFINPDDHSAEKCNVCAHRLDVGLEPACVVVCPTRAILVGDLDDPDSSVAAVAREGGAAVRRPDKATGPKLFYEGAHPATLDPVAARRPAGGLFMWSEQVSGAHHLVSGQPDGRATSAEALLSYDVPHTIPWDWRVSLYTWTKSIAAGAYLVPLLLALFGYTAFDGALVRWAAPVLGGAFLGVTGLLLIADLEHPERFYYLFTRGQRKSWLVMGAYVLTGYALVLGMHFLGSGLGASTFQRWLAYAGAPVALLAAVYTAFLFAQAKGRDLWQSPGLPSHMAVQAVLAGAAATLPIAARAEPGAVRALAWILAIAGAAHLVLVAAETIVPHHTAHARLAVHEMTRGRYRTVFRTGIALSAIGLAAPWIGIAAAPAALAGLLLYEHAYVQGAQAVPLA